MPGQPKRPFSSGTPRASAVIISFDRSNFAGTRFQHNCVFPANLTPAQARAIDQLLAEAGFVAEHSVFQAGPAEADLDFETLQAELRKTIAAYRGRGFHLVKSGEITD
jgi:hypothetical protein